MATIFMLLLDEGVEVWRPVDAVLQADGNYCICGIVPDDECWAFPPGAIVRCELRVFSGGEKGLVAMAI
jgi:hypothetical protein